ncbi:E3 ubiquitin-protein ligase SINA-like 10 [Bienertia sinuspersici]
MAKFSMLRDHEEDEEDVCIRSPKRRRTYTPQTSSTSNQQQQSSSEDDDSIVAPTRSGESISVILSDPDVLDCAICFNPLTIPVFQCDNGHVACSSCCLSLDNKCPSCCGKIGNNRCRAIEKVLESVRVSCCYSRYGCKETISYCKKHEHEENCSYAPCSCPFPDCLFRGSPRRLASHICKEHDDLVKRFRYNSLFSVFLGMDEEILVLLEEREGTLFILNHGNTTAIRCIDPNLSSGRFAYDLVLKGGGTSLKFESFTHYITGKFNDPPSVDYVLVPLYFYHGGSPNGQVKVEICIWDASHASSGCRHLTKLRS